MRDAVGVPDAGSGAAAMNEALDIIRAEHRALAAVINALKFLVAGIRAERISPDFTLLWSMLYYIEAFPEKLHHPKEDDFLFARLRLRTRAADPLLDELARQHAAGEARARDLQIALGHFVAGKDGGFDAFAAAVERFAGFNWKHMSLEETEIFPLAAAHLNAVDWKTIARAFRKNEDPLTGAGAASGAASGADLEFSRLFTRIVSLVPAQRSSEHS